MKALPQQSWTREMPVRGVSQKPHHPAPLKRAGFTLIEVLIALGLSLVLISAIYSAISLHWRYEEVGRDRIERAQISLAVLRLLSEDVGSVVFTPPSNTSQEEEEADEAGTSTGGTAGNTANSSSSSSSAQTSAATTDSTQSSLGIVGTASSLQLDISQPAREDFVPETTNSQTAAPLPANSDNVRVTWGLVTPTTAPTEASGRRSLTINPALSRQVVDRLRVVIELEENSSNEVAMGDASILAREVVSLQFRYFDGYSWVTEWESVTSERLPRAIEITMGYIKPEFKQSGALHLPGSETIISIKHVILVPASSPISGGEL